MGIQTNRLIARNIMVAHVYQVYTYKEMEAYLF